MESDRQEVMLPPTDEELFFQYKEGNQQCFEELTRRYERAVQSYVSRRMGSRSWAEDIWQEILLNVHLHSHQFDVTKKLRPWLYAIATHATIDFQRKNHRNNMNVSIDKISDEHGYILKNLLEGKNPENSYSQMQHKDLQEWLQSALAKLPEIFSDTARLIFIDEHSYQEAADILGISSGTVKSRIHNIRKKLLEIWRESYIQLDYLQQTKVA